MKNFAFLILFIGFIFPSCQKNDVTPDALAKKVSKSDYAVKIDEAGDLFTKHVDMVMGIQSFDFSLIEITTDEIYSKTNCQAYKVISGIPGLSDNCFVVNGNKDGHLLNSPYGLETMDSDFESMIAVDVNNDSNYEIIYTSTILSSYSGYLAGIRWYFPYDAQHSNGGAFVVNYAPWYKINLEKENDQNVYLKYTDDKTDVRIGKIKQSDEFYLQFITDIPLGIKEVLGANYN